MAKKKKKAELKEIAPGILQKNEKTYYIVCKESGKHCYCNADRLQKLADKFGGMDKIQDNYVSRDAKRLKKAGYKKKKLAEMDPDEVVQTSKEWHKDEKRRKEERRVIREERAAERAKIPIDQPGDSMAPTTITRRTSIKMDDGEMMGGGSCLRPKYFGDWNNCAMCNYLEHCKARCKVVKYNLTKEQAVEAKKVLKELAKNR
jgi:hypothetical protein